MSNDGMNEEVPMNEAPVSTGEGVAERYVESELEKAKGSLLRTQIGSVLAVLVLGGYMLYLTQSFRASLEPKEAATIAQGLLSQKLDEGGVQFADYVKKEVPAYIRQAPDYAIKQLPEFRTQLTERVNASIEKYAKESSEQLGGHVDKFLEENKESVGALLKDNSDPAATAKISAELKETFMAYLDEPATDGESVKTKLDKALELLEKVNVRMSRLADANDLSTAEKNTKRAIAILLKTVHEKRMEEGDGEALAPKAIQQASDAVKGAAQDAANTAQNAANAAANATGN